MTSCGSNFTHSNGCVVANDHRRAHRWDISFAIWILAERQWWFRQIFPQKVLFRCYLLHLRFTVSCISFIRRTKFWCWSAYHRAFHPWGQTSSSSEAKSCASLRLGRLLLLTDHATFHSGGRRCLEKTALNPWGRWWRDRESQQWHNGFCFCQFARLCLRRCQLTRWYRWRLLHGSLTFWQALLRFYGCIYLFKVCCR